MDECLEFLEKLDIPYELVEHSAVYTIEEAEAEPALAGRTEIKNLFLQDDKGKRQYLVCMPGHKRLDLKVLASELNEKKLRFCSPEKVETMLGVKPGSVSIFCCLNPNSSHVTIVFDEDLFSEKELGFHPIINTSTVFIQPIDGQALLDAFSQNNVIIKI